jgi:hypothetical protein
MPGDSNKLGKKNTRFRSQGENTQDLEVERRRAVIIPAWV